MAAQENLSGFGDSLPAIPQYVLRKLVSQSQLDFEIDFYGAILKENPNYVEVLRVMGNNLTAKGEYERGLEIDMRLARLCPQDEVVHYNLACSYSLLGMIDLGLEALERALDLGYDEFDYLHEDRDLEAIRKDPRFRQLLANFTAP